MPTASDSPQRPKDPVSSHATRLLVLIAFVSVGWFWYESDSSEADRTAARVVKESLAAGDSLDSLRRHSALLVSRLTPDSLRKLDAFGFNAAFAQIENAAPSPARKEWLRLYLPRANQVRRGGALGPIGGPLTPEKQAAREVMNAAAAACRIYDEGGHLVVECRSSALPADLLRFARSIADADAMLTGEARIIYFYAEGRQFAQADRLSGVLLK